MPQKDFTAEEKAFLEDTMFRWISMGLVSYDNAELTKQLAAELKKRDFVVNRRGQTTTVFAKVQTN